MRSRKRSTKYLQRFPEFSDSIKSRTAIKTAEDTLQKAESTIKTPREVIEEAMHARILPSILSDYAFSI